MEGKISEFDFNSNVANEVTKIQNEVAMLSKETKASMLLQSIRHLDLTSLGPDDSKEKIRDLCLKAAYPIETLDEFQKPLTTAAICIFPTKVKDAVEILQEENIEELKIASVGGGFPSGKLSLEDKVQEIKEAVKNGANEIDIVIDRALVTRREWIRLFDELFEMKKACGQATMKTILSTGELGSMDSIYLVSMMAIMAGTDFIKTSTGKEAVNAILPIGVVMCKAIKDYFNKTGIKIGFKPAGGIRTAEDVLNWMTLVKTQLDDSWMKPELFRIGASSVLDEIVKSYKQLSE